MSAGLLNIEVKSPIERNNDLIGRLITKALVDGGFQCVENYTQQGDPVAPRSVVTLLDAIRSVSPDTFQEKVNIWMDKPLETAFVFDEALAQVELDEVDEVEDVA